MGDHGALEGAEELLDRMGDSYGWRSPEAADAALRRATTYLSGPAARRREDIQRNRIQPDLCRARRALRGSGRITLKVFSVAVTVGASPRRVTPEHPMLSYLTKNGACRCGRKEADPP
jgi:hypothetical protein